MEHFNEAMQLVAKLFVFMGAFIAFTILALIVLTIASIFWVIPVWVYTVVLLLGGVAMGAIAALVIRTY